jgi:hypothetical protein
MSGSYRALQSLRRLLANNATSCLRYLPLTPGTVLEFVASVLATIRHSLQTKGRTHIVRQQLRPQRVVN